MRPVNPVKAIRTSLQRMFTIDTRSLAAYRIGLALVMLGDLSVRARDLRAHYTDSGVLPRSVLIDTYLAYHPYISIHILHGSTTFQALLFLLAAASALCLMVGYRTSLFSVVCWFLTVSLQTRNPLLLHGGDDLFRVLLFWAMFVPLGARWSVDRLKRSDPDPVPDKLSSWGTSGLMLQVCFLYFFTGLLKSHPSWRSEGTAVYLALSIDQFTTPLGKLLLPHHDLLTILTFATLALELAGPYIALFSCFNPLLRCLVVFSFIGFHIGLGSCLELGIFPYICITGWLAFLPGEFWDFLARYAARIPSLANLFRSPAPGQSLLAGLRTRPLRVKPIWEMELIAAFFLVYILLWNLRTSDFKRYERIFPRSLNSIGEAARVDQYWNLFAPFPTLDHGWYVVDAKLIDGTELDVLTGKPVNWNKPEVVSSTYVNERWRKYLMNLWLADNTRYRLYYARWLCRNWNTTHSGGKQLSKFEIVFVLEKALPDYRVTPQEHVVIWRHDCLH